MNMIQDFNKTVLTNRKVPYGSSLPISITYSKTLTPVEIPDPPTIISVVSDDITSYYYQGAKYYSSGKLIVSYNPYNITPIFTSLNTSIATVDSTGLISKVSDGICTILVKVGGITKAVEVDVSVSETTDVLKNIEWNANTLGLNATTNIDSRIENKNMTDNGYIYSYQNHTTRTFTRNPSCWLSDIDLTCISPSNSYDNNKRAGVLVTPRHVLTAAHYQIPIGYKIYFVTEDNTVIERTIIDKVTYPNYSLLYTDITVCLLDSDLPATIQPCKLLGTNYLQYLKNIISTRIPIFSTDQEEKALVTDLLSIVNSVTLRYPIDATRLLFSESKIVGDSGNPSFMILDLGNGPELVLLMMFSIGEAGSGPFLGIQEGVLNNMINSVDTNSNIHTGYTIDIADLSAFESY